MRKDKNKKLQIIYNMLLVLENEFVREYKSDPQDIVKFIIRLKVILVEVMLEK